MLAFRPATRTRWTRALWVTVSVQAVVGPLPHGRGAEGLSAWRTFDAPRTGDMLLESVPHFRVLMPSMASVAGEQSMTLRGALRAPGLLGPSERRASPAESRPSWSTASPGAGGGRRRPRWRGEQLQEAILRSARGTPSMASASGAWRGLMPHRRSCCPASAVRACRRRSRSAGPLSAPSTAVHG